MRVGRRRIIHGIMALTALSASAGRALGRCLTPASPVELLASRLSGLAGGGWSAGVIGKAYLATAPDEADKAMLVALLCPGAPSCYPELLALDEPAFRSWIARRHRADFEEGRTVCVDGWILSRTEARLCALAA
jgi:hypothetical protein